MSEPSAASADAASTPADPEVDAYLAALPDDVGALLGEVRAAIRAAAPDAVESVSYGMPSYRLGKTAVIFFAAWKAHWSLHAVGPDVTSGLDLAPGRPQGDTIKFPLTGPAPVELVAELTRRRAAQARSAH